MRIHKHMLKQTDLHLFTLCSIATDRTSIFLLLVIRSKIKQNTSLTKSNFQLRFFFQFLMHIRSKLIKALYCVSVCLCLYAYANVSMQLFFFFFDDDDICECSAIAITSLSLYYQTKQYNFFTFCDISLNLPFVKYTNVCIIMNIVIIHHPNDHHH